MFRSPTPASEHARAQAVDRINTLVVNGVVLYLAAQDAHWNTKGATFGPLHKLFGEVYSTTHGLVDDLAERVATLGGVANGLAAVASRPALAEQMGAPVLDGLALCERLFGLVAAYVAMVDEAYRFIEGLRLTADANLLQDAVQALEKLGWMLSTHTERA